uniref:uncharacterized protein LOC122607738 isoform X2 n=1 Tax=Erigeron canadensis TaxID=72917 RepID=UPI001CB97406|nr:uncharacterized protein LOC122607738 isoform X2 [Erigeron canadensis]
MATSAFKSTTKRTSSIDESATSSSSSSSNTTSKTHHRRSRSLSRFSRPVVAPEEQLLIVPTPRRKFVNTVRGSEISDEISLDDLALEFFNSSIDNDIINNKKNNSFDDDEVSDTNTTSFSRRSRSVSRNNLSSGDSTNNVSSSVQRRGRSVSRRNDSSSVSTAGGGGVGRVVTNSESRRRRSVSVARHHISDSESDIDLSRNAASQSTSRGLNNGNSRVASFQRPTVSSHRRLTRSTSQAPQPRSHDNYPSDIDLSRSAASQSKSRSINNVDNRVASLQRPTASSRRRLTRSMSQAPQLRSHDDYSSQSSALTDDDLRDARYGRNEIEKTIRAVYAQKKIDHPIGDGANNGLFEAMKKELRSAVNDIMIELEQTMERKPSALSVHDLLYSNKSDAIRKNSTTKVKQPEKRNQDLLTERTFEEQRGQDGYKIVREVLPESKNNANAQKFPYSRKRSNDRNRVSKRLNEEAERYFEDFLSNIEDTDFSSFDGERSDTSSSFAGTTRQRDGALPSHNGSSLPVEMEGVKLPWLKWDGNDRVTQTNQDTMLPPTTPKIRLWDPIQDLELIQENGNGSSSSHGSWNPEQTTANSTNARASKLRETISPQFDMGKYLELERNEELLFDCWRERNIIRSGGLLLCGGVVAPLKSYLHL